MNRLRNRGADSPLAPLLLQLEQARGLDRGVEAARPLMRALTSTPGVRDILQGRAAGHAVHPILVQVPLGTWMSAALLEACHVDRDDARDVQLLTLTGLLAAVPAAVTGWAELAEAKPREQRVGVVHAAANAAGMTLQALAWWQRGRGRRGAAQASSLAALGVLSAAGYLGGHLAVGRKVGTRDRAFTRA